MVIALPVFELDIVSLYIVAYRLHHAKVKRRSFHFRKFTRGNQPFKHGRIMGCVDAESVRLNVVGIMACKIEI